MPIDSNAGASGAQVATGAQPQEGASQAQVANAQSPQVGGADNASGTVDVAQVQRERTEAQREAQNLRARLKTFEDAQKAADNAKLTEAERTTKELDQLRQESQRLQSQLRDERTRNRIVGTAQRLGFADPSDAYQLIDQTSLEYDESGNPKHIDRLLNELLRSKPYLAAAAARATGSADGGVRGTAGTGTDMNQMLRQAAGRPT